MSAAPAGADSPFLGETGGLRRPANLRRPSGSIRLALLVLFVIASQAFAQTSGSSDPSGFLSLTVVGTNGSGSTHLTYLGLGVTRPVVYQQTANAIGPNTITDSAATWTVDQFAGANGAYFVEITSVNGSATAAGVGTTYGLVSNTATTLTLASNLASGIVAPVGYKIRKQWTIAAVFGANNETGLQGGGPDTADLVQLWNGASLDSYYYQTSGGTGWRKVGDASTDAGGTIIPFYSAVLVERHQSANVRFVLNGTVKSGQTSIPVANGDNYLGNVYPTNLTLGGSHLYTGDNATGLTGGDSATADLVMIWNGSSLDNYYYQTTGSGGTGWRKVGAESVDATATILAETSGFIVRRRNGSSFTWVVSETLVGPSGTATPTPIPGGTATPTPGVTPTPGITPTATPGVTATPGGTPTATPEVTATPTPGGSSQTINLSTRMLIQTGDSVGIGGFIVSGTAPKHVLIRAIGPSLGDAGVPNALTDPVLELHGPGAFATITDDNWQDDPTQAAAIIATGIPPTNNLESAIDAMLDPGAYTAIVSGKNGATGIGLVEVYDLSPSDSSILSNISTRAFVNTGAEIVIAGFILGNGNDTDRVVVRGIGPSLTDVGVANPIADPQLQLRNSDGAQVQGNNDWQDNPTQADELTAAGLAPSNNAESGLVATLPPGLYTALLSGVTNDTGIGLVEVYDLP